MSNGYSIYEYVNIDSNQDIITTSQKHINDTVAITNSIQNSSDFTNVSFVEINSGDIKFNVPFVNAETMVLQYSALSNGLFNDIISNNNSNPNSVFKKYGTATKLQKNNKYTVHIELKDLTKEWNFTSETYPRYASIQKIRTDTGDLLESVTDEEINSVIYVNSKELQFIIDDKARVNGPIADIYLAIRIKNAYKFWVRYKTDLDLINAIYLSICGVNGTNHKKIGDIDVSQQLLVSSLSNMISRLTQLFNLYNETVNSTEEPVVSFTKSGTLSPYKSRGVF